MGDMNGVERAFALKLADGVKAGTVLWWRFEAVNLRLGAATFYRPDFLTLAPDGQLHVYETKAWWKGGKGKPGRVGWQEDARVKIKVAAGLFPWLRFHAAWCRDGVWEVEDFRP